MTGIRLIEIKEGILADNDKAAEEIRKQLRSRQVFMLNLMASPGGGKTSLIIQTLRGLKGLFRTAVIEGDIDSMVDAEKVAQEGIPAVQLRTGGACHLDAVMVDMALREMDLFALDLIIVENIGNLVCPAEFDTGAVKNVMILSVPEGDDKPLKYPLMFTICDALVVNKTDYLAMADFDMKVLKERVLTLNPKIKIFEVSCKTGEGIPAWTQWLREEVEAFKR
ncbi:MAG TPA: hydrogenase nickel incorporation protein HypB [Syntrophales bacterium]|nr:hydrogenase nickel incorporation protein HypB [Syntrophales bacterium]HOX94676.1 hydrogenase nickel incorporation protein HypB [Syntrophales bacterium]HPI56860.1 hydrogenase nickel incorporation protein HypB [Syntrophales bacterium]HPN23446.1 hydrogenase nickel incorporation protein HypB [Syntrophales bacterium]HQM28029.1 hydrogenase nickel incorporation protein HypB [Syntrophales bacterium]